MRRHPNNTRVRLGSSSWWVAPELADDPNLHVLSDPDLLFARPECQVVKDQKKIKVGRIRLALGSAVRGLYLKRYNVFSWRYRIGYLLMPSGAARSWAGAAILLEAGFRTGRPLAAVECRSWGMLTKSFYLSEEIPGAKTADAYWREELKSLTGAEGVRRRRRFLINLASLFRSLHAANIYHNDLKDANILVCSGSGEPESFYLLDLEGIRRYPSLNRRRQVKNLVQLNRTMGRFLRRAEKLFWLKTYLGSGFSDRRVKREWIEKVLKESARRDRRSLRKS